VLHRAEVCVFTLVSSTATSSDFTIYSGEEEGNAEFLQCTQPSEAQAARKLHYVSK